MVGISDLDSHIDFEKHMEKKDSYSKHLCNKLHPFSFILLVLIKRLLRDFHVRFYITTRH